MKERRRSSIESADGGDLGVIRYWKRRLTDKKPPKWLVERSKRNRESTVK